MRLPRIAIEQQITTGWVLHHITKLWIHIKYIAHGWQLPALLLLPSRYLSYPICRSRSWSRWAAIGARWCRAPSREDCSAWRHTGGCPCRWQTRRGTAGRRRRAWWSHCPAGPPPHRPQSRACLRCKWKIKDIRILFGIVYIGGVSALSLWVIFYEF